MRSVLALDLGSQCGYALLRADGKIESGSLSFHPKPKEGQGLRYGRFRAWLVEMKQAHPELHHVVYEVIMGHGPGQVYAAHVYGGFLAMLQLFGDQHQVTYQGFGVGTIKKQFAGSGRAQKIDMINQCKALGFKPADDNEADAIALLHVATNTAPLLTMSGATPKGKRPPKPQPELAPGANPF